MKKIPKKIINPETGRFVNSTGLIGKGLIKMNEIHTNKKKYNKIKELWNWWSNCNNETRQKVVNSGWWNTKLNDPIKGEYPFYIMSYEDALVKAHNIIKNND
jgi:hypothetical protein